jgi:hypothetical protein
MFEMASLLSLYFGFAVLYGASARVLPRALHPPKRCGRAAMRVIALLSTAAGVWLWTFTGSVTDAMLVATTALAAFATLFVLLAPAYPRMAWATVLACPPVVLSCSIAGALGE